MRGKPSDQNLHAQSATAEEPNRLDAVTSAASTVSVVTLIGVLGFLVGLILTVLAIQFLQALGIGVQNRPTVLIVVSVLMLQGVGFGSVGLGYLYLSGIGFGILNVRWPGIRDFAWVLGGVIGLFVVLLSVNFVLLAFGVQTAQQDIVEVGLQDPNILLVLIPLSLLLIGPGEELLFRGVIQQLLREKFGVVGAISAASVLFALAHLGGLAGDGIVSSLLVFFVLSIVLGTVYEYSGNLVVPALIHGTFNAIQFFLLFLAATSEMPVGF